MLKWKSPQQIQLLLELNCDWFTAIVVLTVRKAFAETGQTLTQELLWVIIIMVIIM